MEDPPYKILKLCVLGDLGVGKTSLATCFVTGKSDANYRPTYQACHFHKYLSTPDHNAYIQIWDTSGTDRYRSLSPYILRESNGILLVYDVSDSSTFSSIVQYWLSWVREMSDGDQLTDDNDVTRLVLVGNKTDKMAQRQVDTRVAKKFARENRLVFHETSALTKDNVDIVFLDGVNLLGDTMENTVDVNDPVSPNLRDIDVASSFCQCL